MSQLKNEQLFWAAYDGDLNLVKSLAEDPSVNVNWQHENQFRLTALYNACQEDHLAVVEYLLTHPRIDPNLAEIVGGTPFYAACRSGHTSVVSLMMADPRVDVARPSNKGYTALNSACFAGYQPVVSLLLADPRVDVNRPNDQSCTPLYQASQNGHLPIVQLILASGREVDTKLRSNTPHDPVEHNHTAAEWARDLPDLPKPSYLDNETYARVCDHGPAIADLLDEYEKDPVGVRQRLRSLPQLREVYIQRTFALVVFFSDGYLQLPTVAVTSQIGRFFAICSQLPLDLQMVLCSRMFGSGKDVILSRDSEAGFRWLARC